MNTNSAKLLLVSNLSNIYFKKELNEFLNTKCKFRLFETVYRKIGSAYIYFSNEEAFKDALNIISKKNIWKFGCNDIEISQIDIISMKRKNEGGEAQCGKKKIKIDDITHEERVVALMAPFQGIDTPTVRQHLKKTSENFFEDLCDEICKYDPAFTPYFDGLKYVRLQNSKPCTAMEHKFLCDEEHENRPWNCVDLRFGYNIDERPALGVLIKEFPNSSNYVIGSINGVESISPIMKNLIESLESYVRTSPYIPYNAQRLVGHWYGIRLRFSTKLQLMIVVDFVLLALTYKDIKIVMRDLRDFFLRREGKQYNVHSAYFNCLNHLFQNNYELICGKQCLEESSSSFTFQLGPKSKFPLSLEYEDKICRKLTNALRINAKTNVINLFPAYPTSTFLSRRCNNIVEISHDREKLPVQQRGIDDIKFRNNILQVNSIEEALGDTKICHELSKRLIALILDFRSDPPSDPVSVNQISAFIRSLKKLKQMGIIFTIPTFNIAYIEMLANRYLDKEIYGHPFVPSSSFNIVEDYSKGLLKIGLVMRRVSDLRFKTVINRELSIIDISDEQDIEPDDNSFETEDTHAYFQEPDGNERNVLHLTALNTGDSTLRIDSNQSRIFTGVLAQTIHGDKTIAGLLRNNLCHSDKNKLIKILEEFIKEKEKNAFVAGFMSVYGDQGEEMANNEWKSASNNFLGLSESDFIQKRLQSYNNLPKTDQLDHDKQQQQQSTKKSVTKEINHFLPHRNNYPSRIVNNLFTSVNNYQDNQAHSYTGGSTQQQLYSPSYRDAS